jgi:hypothetical protein
LDRCLHHFPARDCNRNFKYIQFLCIHIQHSWKKPPGTSSSQNSFWDCYGSFAEQRLFKCRVPIFKRVQVWPQDSSEVGTAQRHSVCKYRSHA